MENLNLQIGAMLAVIAVLLAAPECNCAKAQRAHFAHGVRLGPQAALWQARSCMGETQFNLDECTAMTWVHIKRAQQAQRAGRRVSLSRVIRCYSSPVRPLEGCGRRRGQRGAASSGTVPADIATGQSRTRQETYAGNRWVQLVTRVGRKPRAWRRRFGQWENKQAQLSELYAHVSRIFRGEIPDPCPDTILYGGPEEVDPGAPLLARGYVLSACDPSPSAQRYWRRP